MKTEPLADKFTSFGWHVVEIDGHDITQLKKSLGTPPSHKDKPTAILMNTCTELRMNNLPVGQQGSSLRGV